jgi:predicted component of type VI protein secretion system
LGPSQNEEWSYHGNGSRIKLMPLYLDILEGASAGERMPLVEGAVVGRTEGEIRIRDAKISSRHAKVKKDEKGKLFLVDDGSTNGLRLNGIRESQVLLENGVKFQIGKTWVRVIEYEREKAPSPPTPRDWKGLLVQQIASISLKDNLAEASRTRPKAFNPPVCLKVKTGIQASQEWVLGFGPRNFGADTLEFELFEPTTPDLAFTISPDEDGPIFRTEHGGVVMLNEKAVSSDILREGDQIRIGDSLIEVSFLK